MGNHIIVINGKGGVGKDTLIELFKEYLKKDFKVWNISAITPIKMAASTYLAWDGGKTDKDRKFLSDLRALVEEYNDLPMEYLKTKTYDFYFDNPKSDSDRDSVLFVHIREPRNISRYVQWVKHSSYFSKYQVVTLLVLGNNDSEIQHGNPSDDNVAEYQYDYTYLNDKSKTEAGFDFSVWLRDLVLNHDKS